MIFTRRVLFGLLAIVAIVAADKPSPLYKAAAATKTSAEVVAKDAKATKDTKKEDKAEARQDQYGAPAVESYAAPAQEAYGAPVVQSYAAPAQEVYAAPAQEAYGAPAQETYAAPAQEAYGAPAQAYAAPAQEAYAAPAQEAYGAPLVTAAPSYSAPAAETYAAPAQEAYGAPQAPAQDTYGSPSAPVQYSAPAATPGEVQTQGYYYYYYPVSTAPVQAKPSYAPPRQGHAGGNNPLAAYGIPIGVAIIVGIGIIIGIGILIAVASTTTTTTTTGRSLINHVTNHLDDITDLAYEAINMYSLMNGKH